MIVRSPRPQHSWTVLTNATLRDHRISFRARGLLAYLLSMPDHWRTSSTRLALVTTEGRDAIRAALRELEEAGYLRRIRRQDTRGRWQTLTVIYDEPGAAHAAEPVDNPAGNPVDNAVDNSTSEAGIPGAGKSGAIGKTTSKDMSNQVTSNTGAA